MTIEISEAAGGKGPAGNATAEHQKQYLIRMTKQI